MSEQEFDGRHDARPDDPIDPLALALFGIRDHVRNHHGCLAKRGIGGHHFDAADECALADIVRRYGDVRSTEVGVVSPSPFTLSGHTLSELDELHAAAGLGSEWLASEARRVLVHAITVRGEVQR
ncbi:MAG: hypothetical protein EPO65_00400 [Dehalococcoidia bacterium]|nr:MAG: hypothetical protein EPO65_00400 [Dehalococcoidia bacterium]